MKAAGRYPCPRCSELSRPDTPFFPICSERCRLVDLGRWLEGSYRVAGEKVDLPEQDDFEGGRE